MLLADAAHAEALGAKDDKVYADVHRAMAFLGKPEANDPNKLLELVRPLVLAGLENLGTWCQQAHSRCQASGVLTVRLRAAALRRVAQALAVGQTNFRVMQLLSEAHSDTFGHPEPTEVSLVPRNGKCILVTGHDMHDLHMLLQQIDAMGVDVDVYTHGEMLPAHGYPGARSSPPSLLPRWRGAGAPVLTSRRRRRWLPLVPQACASTSTWRATTAALGTSRRRCAG